MVRRILHLPSVSASLLCRLLWINCLLFLLPIQTQPGQAQRTAGRARATTADEILKDLDYKPVASAHVLAFVSREDSRPWYVDDALLVLKMSRGGWMLVHAVRNPRFPPGHRGGSNRWLVHHVHNAPFVGDRRFEKRPDRGEVDRFLKDNQWKIRPDRQWRVTRSEVDEAVWQQVLGYSSPFASAGLSPGAKPETTNSRVPSR